MAELQSGNPAFKKGFFDVRAQAGEAPMTMNGAVNKTGFLLVIMTATATFGWQMGLSELGIGIVFGALLIAVISSFVLIFNRQLAPVLAPVYAATEGLLLGAISALYDIKNPGITLNALMLTFSTLGLMLGLYHFKIIVVTDRLRSTIVLATLSIVLVYILDFVLSFFTAPLAMIHQSSTFGIIFSLVVVGVAAMNLLLDFNMIERSAKVGAPKYMEWYGGFALLLTLVWLYLEILRLLSKLNKR